jgi:hypothetical protein
MIKVTKKDFIQIIILPWGNMAAFGCTSCEGVVMEDDNYCSTCGEEIDKESMNKALEEIK